MDILDRVLDQTQRAPKFVDPATHSVLDYLTISAFFIMAGLFWGRHRRAAAAALINGGMVLGLSMLTDYPGGLKKVSFRDHGKGDILQALTAAGLPSLLGFGESGAALPFRIQALNEAMVIGITDFDSSLAHEQSTESEQRAVA
jgi:hypothetical protein